MEVLAVQVQGSHLNRNTKHDCCLTRGPPISPTKGFRVSEGCEEDSWHKFQGTSIFLHDISWNVILSLLLTRVACHCF